MSTHANSFSLNYPHPSWRELGLVLKADAEFLSHHRTAVCILCVVASQFMRFVAVQKRLQDRMPVDECLLSYTTSGKPRLFLLALCMVHAT